MTLNHNQPTASFPFSAMEKQWAPLVLRRPIVLFQTCIPCSILNKQFYFIDFPLKFTNRSQRENRKKKKSFFLLKIEWGWYWKRKQTTKFWCLRRISQWSKMAFSDLVSLSPPIFLSFKPLICDPSCESFFAAHNRILYAVLFDCFLWNKC